MKPIEKLGAPYGICRKCRVVLTKGESKCHRCGVKITK